MEASWKGIRLFLCPFQTVLGLPIERLPELLRPLASAAASSYWKSLEASTTDCYINIYNYICSKPITTKLSRISQYNMCILFVRYLFMVCYYK